MGTVNGKNQSMEEIDIKATMRKTRSMDMENIFTLTVEMCFKGTFVMGSK